MTTRRHEAIARRSLAMNTLLQDVRFALRQLRRSPGFCDNGRADTGAWHWGDNGDLYADLPGAAAVSLPVAKPSQLYKVGKDVNCCVSGGLQDDWSLFSYSLYKTVRDQTPGTLGIAAVDSAAVATTARGRARDDDDAAVGAGGERQLLFLAGCAPGARAAC